jgi:hypothetical protein
MSSNIIHELKKFLNNPNQITLEFSFVDFESSVFQGIRTIKNLTTKRTNLTVILVKNRILGSVSFFFRDGPTYQFALTVEEAKLYNDNNSKECLVNNFIVLANEPIQGNQLIISSYSITIYASINDNKPRGLDSLSFNQIYSDCTSVKNYSYALEIETLKKPTYQEPKKNSSNVNSKGSNIFFKIGIILIVMISISILSTLNNNKQNTNTDTDDFEVDTISIDTTSSLPEISEFWIEKKYLNISYSVPESMKLIENLSNDNQHVIVDEDNNIGITISHSIIPEGSENETIRTLIGSNKREYALSTNNENRKNFSDFQMINYGFDMLGNAESFLVTQSSTELSGKNISMIMKTYAVISSPNYYSISLSYPDNSESKEVVIKKIVDSFKFNFTDIEEDSNMQEAESLNDNIYSVITNRAYFYSLPDENSKKTAYLIQGEVVNALDENSNFIYIEYLNSQGNTTNGWILKNNLVKNRTN